MNITELARKLKVSPEELKARLPELGFHIGPKAIQIPDSQAQKVIKLWPKLKKLEEYKEKIKERRKEIIPEKKEEKKEIKIPSVITVAKLAEKMGISVVKLISELMKQGVYATINENLDFEIAAIIAESLGYQVEKQEKEEKKELSLKERIKKIIEQQEKKEIRPPIVVVMGHIDHGKTALLDKIRQTNIREKEAGGITQHIGAYQVEIEKEGKKDLITFIDTPGHEAFNEMRKRGGQVADIAILVIAADDKIQPQTIESLKIIQEANLPFVVAINKIDKPEADPERIKKELAEINLVPEEWGGNVLTQNISAKTGEGIKELLDLILLVANLNQEKLLTTKKGPVVGTIIESHLDKKIGPVATAIIFSGILKIGDEIVCGEAYGKVKAMKDFLGNNLKKAEPSMPVQIIGFKSVPLIGSILKTGIDLKKIKRKSKIKKLKRIEEKRLIKEKTKEAKILNIILKSDVWGSLEALKEAILKLETPEVKINILKASLGNLNEKDIEEGKNFKALIIGFNVGINPEAEKLAKEIDQPFKLSKVIYEILEQVQEKIEEIKEKKFIEIPLAKIKILAIFKKTPQGQIVGGKVIEGKVKKNAKARIWRNDLPLAEGIIKQLQINKIDVDEVEEGKECGILYQGKGQIKINDILDIFEEKEK